MSARFFCTFTLAAAAAIAATVPGSARAVGVPGQGTWETTLLGRDIDGVPVAANSASAVFLYDTVLKVTWLRDWNLSGLKTLDSAETWAKELQIGSFGNAPYNTFRLPSSSRFCENYSMAGGTDCGYNVLASSSALAYLWYVELGNKAYTVPGTGIFPQLGWGLSNTGPFMNMQSGNYWGGGVSVFSDARVTFNTFDGYQGTSGPSAAMYATAVLPYDVALVPEAQSALLMLFGLSVGTIVIRRRTN